MPETLQFHDGQAYTEARDENPYPVKIMQDVQSRNIILGTDGPPQVVVSTSIVTLIAPANPMRRSLLITNLTGTQLCHLGPAGITASTSRAILAAAVGSSMTINHKDAVYGLSISAAQTVLVWEEEFSG